MLPGAPLATWVRPAHPNGAQLEGDEEEAAGPEAPAADKDLCEGHPLKQRFCGL